MKIVAPGTLGRTASRTRKAGGAAGSGGFASSLEGASETRASSGAPGMSPIASVDALLALQGEPDARDGERKETKRGHALLDELEVIRTGLLVGSIPRGRLEALARMLTRRDFPSSPGLASLIDEIELRVKVELAKLSAI